MDISQIIILSIETSGENCSVALSSNEKLLAEYSVAGKNVHDRLLAEMSKRIVLDSGYDFQKLNAVAVSSGPGSFTGLRIGASLAKGLCFDNSPLLIAVPTLTALANNCLPIAKKLKKDFVIALTHSHKNLFYYQIFDSGLNSKSDIFLEEKSIIDNIINEDFFLCGTGANYFTNFTKVDDYCQLSSKVISKLAFIYYQEGIFTQSELFSPEYIQEFVPKNK